MMLMVQCELRFSIKERSDKIKYGNVLDRFKKEIQSLIVTIAPYLEMK